MTEQDIERIAQEEFDLYGCPYYLDGKLEDNQAKFKFAKDLRNVYDLWKEPWEPVLDELGCDVSPWHPNNASMRIVERVIQLIKEEQQNV